MEKSENFADSQGDWALGPALVVSADHCSVWGKEPFPLLLRCPSLGLSNSGAIALEEVQAWHVFKTPRQFRFAAEPENHCSRAGPAELCAHVCVCVCVCARSQMPSLCMSPSSPVSAHPPESPCGCINGKVWGSSPNVPRLPPTPLLRVIL